MMPARFFLRTLQSKGWPNKPNSRSTYYTFSQIFQPYKMVFIRGQCLKMDLFTKSLSHSLHCRIVTDVFEDGL